MKRDFQSMQGKKSMPVRQVIFELQAAPHLNDHIASLLISLAKMCKNQGLKHKFTAYTTAAHSLSMLSKKIEMDDIPEELEGVSLSGPSVSLVGVGVSIRKKIVEIVQTGRLLELDTLLQDPDIVALNVLSQVTGIGPKSARAFIQQGACSLEAVCCVFF
jgi:DNA polymerase/3'-5' exonuclease PolX